MAQNEGKGVTPKPDGTVASHLDIALLGLVVVGVARGDVMLVRVDGRQPVLIWARDRDEIGNEDSHQEAVVAFSWEWVGTVRSCGQ